MTEATNNNVVQDFTPVTALWVVVKQVVKDGDSLLFGSTCRTPWTLSNVFLWIRAERRVGDFGASLSKKMNLGEDMYRLDTKRISDALVYHDGKSQLSDSIRDVAKTNSNSMSKLTPVIVKESASPRPSQRYHRTL
ncbi:hypothetical protein PPL_11622 [Heterostelium album PN500]|uniref:Uncharacterized protein n=1 Tax=Heterostelium pallidum (strain ATCC 26659 / Pp 5 / PN500) TaxID=670386 RepID=D3BV96_HETP5|nr:hypothetical protein PPL_11622 [Heterostelium album PN500]EFA74653.1 hypothetical protein PPL_11622 [Heterostelium album PN500]|eukprot:XP_020426787.1 hypothetical protein PPL_11622 [Heterostelium album PN500]